jgi:hypothetical protein
LVYISTFLQHLGEQNIVSTLGLQLQRRLGVGDPETVDIKVGPEYLSAGAWSRIQGASSKLRCLLQTALCVGLQSALWQSLVKVKTEPSPQSLRHSLRAVNHVAIDVAFATLAYHECTFCLLGLVIIPTVQHRNLACSCMFRSHFFHGSPAKLFDPNCLRRRDVQVFASDRLIDRSLGVIPNHLRSKLPSAK